MHIDKKVLRNIFFVLGGCVVLAWLLLDTARVQIAFSTVWKLVSPFVTGAVIAFVFNVPMRGIERQLEDIRRPGLRRGIAIVLTIFMLVLIIAFVVELLIPQIEKTVESLVETIPSFAKRTVAKLSVMLEDHPELYELVQSKVGDLQKIDWSNLIDKTVSFVGNGVSSIMGGAFNAIGSVTSTVVDTFVGIAFAVYCLARKEILATQSRRVLYSILPEHRSDEVIRIMRLTNNTFSNFISGQCLEACILGCLFAVTMLIFKMPYIPLVSVIIAVTALVPVVGAFVGCALGAFFILVDNPIQALSFIAIFLVLQQLENNLIYPRVVGTSIGLPGMWVLVAVTIGGEVMGVAGMLLMIPLASVLYTLLGEFTQKRLTQKEIAPEKLVAQLPELSSRFKKNKEKKERSRLVRIREKMKNKK